MAVALAVPTLFDPVGDRGSDEKRLTLDALIVTTWTEAFMSGVAVCPICGGVMGSGPTESHPTEVIAAVCGDCGTELS